MSELTLEKLTPSASKKIKPFLEDILNKYRDKIHSINVTGTSVTNDFNEKHSDVNSVFILHKMDLKFLELLAPLGKKYSRQNVAAPLIMTPDYIRTSLDVFPIEFLSFKLVHATVYGEDIFADIEIGRMDLRHQCERELKTKLIRLRQGYLSSLGDRKVLTEGFIHSISDYIPLFRGIITLFGKEPPLEHAQVINTLSEATGVDTAIFSKVLKEKHDRTKLSMDELNTIFEDYYAAAEKLVRIVNDIKE